MKRFALDISGMDLLSDTDYDRLFITAGEEKITRVCLSLSGENKGKADISASFDRKKMKLKGSAERTEKERFKKDLDPDHSLPRMAARQLKQYLQSERSEFDLPLSPAGTAFQKQVWRQAGKIPFGETRSYGKIAKKIGRPRAARAVGAALSENPILIIIPCHRVIGAKGDIGGFAPGKEIKRNLLKLEGAFPG